MLADRSASVRIWSTASILDSSTTMMGSDKGRSLRVVWNGNATSWLEYLSLQKPSHVRLHVCRVAFESSPRSCSMLCTFVLRHGAARSVPAISAMMISVARVQNVRPAAFCSSQSTLEWYADLAALALSVSAWDDLKHASARRSR